MPQLVYLSLTLLAALQLAIQGGAGAETGAAASATAEGSVPTPSEKFPFFADMSAQDNFYIFWKHGNNVITFEAVVKTSGWFGLGFSTNGKMMDADLIFGWHVDNNSKGLSDRHGSKNDHGHVTPIVDTTKDYELISSSRDGEWMRMKFSRNFDTCDLQDMIISSSTIRVMWSIGNSVPPSFSYHNVNRGVKSINLLDKPIEVKLEQDYRTVAVTMDQLRVPDKDTTYECMGFSTKELNLTTKSHLIRYEPIITPGNEAMVHHILIYMCYHNVSEEYHGFVRECFTDEMPEDIRKCRAIAVAWAVGEKMFNFPPAAGYSIGGPEDPTFFRMEVHYDNPQRVSGRKDSSGLRFYVTESLRPNEVGLLSIGRNSNPSLLIPPNVKEFWATSHCSHKCLEKGMAEQNIEKINVFASMLHTHLLGRKIRTRQIRNGKEIGNVGWDDSYDFNFQETRHLNPTVELKKGDDLIIECGYDSSGVKKATVGGQSTKDEMCYDFMLYYPKMPVAHCYTAPDLGDFLKSTCINTGDEMIVTDEGPHKGEKLWMEWYAGKVNYNWTESRADLYQYYEATGKYWTTWCATHDNKAYEIPPMYPIKISEYLTVERGACPNQAAKPDRTIIPKVSSKEEADRIIQEICTKATNSMTTPIYDRGAALGRGGQSWLVVMVTTLTTFSLVSHPCQ